MASRRIEDLHPRLQPIARQFIEQAEAAGLDLLVTCTYNRANTLRSLISRCFGQFSRMFDTPDSPFGDL